MNSQCKKAIGRTFFVVWGLILLGTWTGHATEENSGRTNAISESEARARVRRIAAEVEKLRERPFKQDVPVQVQSAEDFRRYVNGQLDEELPEDVAKRQVVALYAFGLLPAGYDLRKGVADLYVSQAGAYYDPETKAFYILFAGLPDDQMDTIIFHELDHALQDQYFDLGGLRKAALENPNEDVRNALAYVFEGEASYVMFVDQMKRAGRDLESIPAAQREVFFRMMRDIGRDALVRAAKTTQPSGPQGEDIRKAIEAMKDVPDYLFWGLQDPYLKGQYAIYKVLTARGWDGVDELYRRPPTSTEQVLHPEKLAEPRDEPIAVELPDIAGQLGRRWKSVYANTLGEAGINVFFDEYVRPLKEKASSGWGGDRYAVFEGPHSSLLLYWKTIWDSEGDAVEFEEALKKVGKETFCGGKHVDSFIVRDGAGVTLVAGPQGESSALVQAYLSAAQ